MPDQDEMFVDLPALLAGMLSDLDLAFKKKNASAMNDLGVATGPIFRMADSVIDFRGRMAHAEGNKVLFFPSEQSERGAEFAVRMPVKVDHPPEDTPWSLAMGVLVFDPEIRKQVYDAAISAITFVSMDQIGCAPIWRLGAGEYFVVVPMGAPRGAIVTVLGGRVEATPYEGAELLSPIMRLAGLLTSKYAAVLGKIERGD
jgi:hypothetical protein